MSSIETRNLKLELDILLTAGYCPNHVAFCGYRWERLKIMMRICWSITFMLLGVGSAVAQFEIPGTRGPATTEPLNPIRPAATPDVRPTSPYDLSKEHGPWLVVVKSFRAERETNSNGRYEPDLKVKELAESFAEFIRKEYRINAFVYPRGWELRQQRAAETIEAKQRIRKYYEGQGIEPTPQMLKVRTVSIPDEYTVFVAPARVQLKDREMAIDFANQVRKLKAPSEFNDKLLQGNDNEATPTKGNSFNAFLASMAGKNPMIKEEYKPETVKADKFLMDLNSGETYSLLHKTRKPWTLMVQSYGGGGTIQQTGATAGDDSQASDRLERIAVQAHDVAKMLRNQKIDAFVMHTRYRSMIFVGEYDSADDERLIANLKVFKSMQLKDKESGKVLDTFMEKPQAVMIPRP